MSLTKCTVAVDNISTLADKPALTAAQLKAKFDKTGADLKDYINNTLTDEIDTLASSKTSNSDFVVITGSVGANINTKDLTYPTGFSFGNCVAVALQYYKVTDTSFIGNHWNQDDNIGITFYETKMVLGFPSDGAGTYYKVVLKKI